MNIYDPGLVGDIDIVGWFILYRGYAYALGVLLLGALIFVSVRKRLASLEQKRLQNLSEIDGFEPIEAEPPRPQASWGQIRQRIEGRITGRYTIIRKGLGLSIFMLVFLALVIPFVGQLPATLISLLVTSVTVVLGIAARPFVENLISGVVLSFSNHFYTGDTVSIDGHYGTIEDISLTHTTIKLWDWRRYVIPNQRMLTKEVVNYSHTEDNFIWSKVDFYVAYGTDLVALEQAALEIARNNPWFRGSADPEMWVMELKHESVHCWLAAWTQTPSESWSWKAHTRYHLVETFQKMGVQAHVYHSESESKPPVHLQAQGPDIRPRSESP